MDGWNDEDVIFVVFCGHVVTKRLQTAVHSAAMPGWKNIVPERTYLATQWHSQELQHPPIFLEHSLCDTRTFIMC